MTDDTPKTIDEILADVAALQAKARAAQQDVARLSVGSRVKLSSAAHERLAQSARGDRTRSPDEIGEVTGFDDRSGRNLVKWWEPCEYTEPLAAKFLEVVG